MRSTLIAVCAVTLLATAYLTISVLILQPPRVNYASWFAIAAVIVLQGTTTLIAGAQRRKLPAPVIAGSVVVVALGLWLVRSTLTSAHFEGYALVLGAMLAVQGALTLTQNPVPTRNR